MKQETNKNKVFSVYIHIPFCKSICSYCDFCKVFYHEKLVDEYLESLEKEVLANYKGDKIETVYIGGGTPSSLSIKQLEKLFEIVKIFDLSILKEFTFEVNPEDIEEEKLAILKKNLVNRISIGHETKFRKYLELLERKKSFTKEDFRLVQKYFSNISVDLMYGFKGEEIDEVKEEIDYILSLGVTHISTYSLILEEHTKLFIKDYERLEDDIDAKIYTYLQEVLEQNGFYQYEISNFSKNGYESLHNLVYWNNEKYYGFGVGAAGYLENRYTNTKSITKYLRGNNKKEIEILSKQDEMVYEAILGLRKVEGIKKQTFVDKFGCTVEQSFDIIELIEKNMLEETEEFIRIPKDKLYLENQILITFLEVKEHE